MLPYVLKIVVPRELHSDHGNCIDRNIVVPVRAVIHEDSMNKLGRHIVALGIRVVLLRPSVQKFFFSCYCFVTV